MNFALPLLATLALFLCLWIYNTGRMIHLWMDRIRPLMADGKERCPVQVEQELGCGMDMAAVYCALERLEQLGELSSRVETYFVQPRVYFRAVPQLSRDRGYDERALQYRGSRA